MRASSRRRPPPPSCQDSERPLPHTPPSSSDTELTTPIHSVRVPRFDKIAPIWSAEYFRRPDPLQTTPPSISDAPTPSKLLRRVFPTPRPPPNYSAEYFRRPNPLQITPPSISDAPTPSKLLRRVFPTPQPPPNYSAEYFRTPQPPPNYSAEYFRRPNPLQITPPSISDAPTPPNYSAEYFWELEHPNYSVARRSVPSQCGTLMHRTPAPLN